MITHKEAVLRGDEGLANDLQGSTHIQGIGLMHAHPRMLIKRGVFIQSFADFHSFPPFWLCAEHSRHPGLILNEASGGLKTQVLAQADPMSCSLSALCSPNAIGLPAARQASVPP